MKINEEQFKTLFLPDSKYKNYLQSIPKIHSFQGIKYIQEEFKNRIEKKSNYNLFFYSHFQESGVGKSYTALYIAEQLQKIANFDFQFYPDFATFLSSNSIRNQTIVLIDDTTVSRFGIGSSRILEQFNEFLGISARYSQICFMFTTTLDLRKFDFLINIHRIISVIGFNTDLKLSLSFTFQKSVLEATYFLSKIPQSKILKQYLKMKEEYTKKFFGMRKGNIAIKSIVQEIPISQIQEYNKKELTAILETSYNLTQSEITKIVSLLKMKESFKLPKSYYTENEYKKYKQKIDKNKEF